MNEAPATRINRRTVVKGIAWSVPAVAVSTALPALAVSPEDVQIEIQGICKYRGGSSGLDCKQDYAAQVIISNSDPLDACVTVLDATLSQLLPFVGAYYTDGTPISPSGGCLLTVPAQSSVTLNLVFNSTNSADLAGTFTLNWTYQLTAGGTYSDTTTFDYPGSNPCIIRQCGIFSTGTTTGSVEEPPAEQPAAEAPVEQAPAEQPAAEAPVEEAPAAVEPAPVAEAAPAAEPAAEAAATAS